jgi:hypothetical protein
MDHVLSLTQRSSKCWHTWKKQIDDSNFLPPPIYSYYLFLFLFFFFFEAVSCYIAKANFELTI